MAIHPIDLQTMYTQMDKVAKSAIQQQQGAVLQNAMQMDARLQKNIEKTGFIEQTQKDEKKNNIKDKKESSSENPNQQGRKKEEEKKDEAPVLSVIKDPALGTHLDVSG